jgi:RNA polymerase sigma-70 factor (ECF subfamily)
MIHEIDEIWKDSHDRLAAFIGSRVGHDDAEDILHEVFLKMRMKLHQLENPDHVKAWMFRIASNAIIDHFRSERPTEELPEWLAETEADPAEEAKNELSQCLRPMIEALPPDYQEAVLLSELDGRSQREVAETQGLSLSGAKSRLQRGRAMLREMIAACCTLELDRGGKILDFENKSSSGSCC